MKKLVLSLMAAAALGLSVPALAQQKAPEAGPKVPIPKGVFYRGQAVGQYLAKDRLIGAKVHNKDGAIIGDIEDLIVGPGNQIVGVVMGTGGFLGAGEKRVGVQLTALQFTQKGGVPMIVLPQATKDILTALQPYKRADPKKSLYERAKEKARELTDKTKETTKDAAQVAKEKAGPALEKAKDAAGAALQKAKEAVKPGEAPAEKK